MTNEQIEQYFQEGVRNARTWNDLTAAFAWREFQLKHRILGPLLDAFAYVASLMVGAAK